MPNENDEGVAEGFIGSYLGLEEPRERNPGFLTYQDREFLYNPHQFGRDYWPKKRQRVRDRTKNAVLDFDYLRGLQIHGSRDMELIFGDAEPGSELYDGLVQMLAVCYAGLTASTSVDFEEFVEEGVLRGERGYLSDELGYNADEDGTYVVENVNVRIDKERRRVPDIDDMHEKLDRGERLSDVELGALLRAERDDGEAHELLERARDIIYNRDGEGKE